jgi:hypothetical protein
MNLTAEAARSPADPPITPDRRSGATGGAPASVGAASLYSGALAVLAAALCLAGPALRRRLRLRPATSWPGAFVPLLERPG